ncbi:hypothetical protein J6590_054081 [Homalodisca vitripennis]|nr:hypothetical protein J6590_054081 [Homalodisca vitripennis]
MLLRRHSTRFYKETTDKFSEMLEPDYDNNNFTADHVYNVDETGLTVFQSKTPHVVDLKLSISGNHIIRA